MKKNFLFKWVSVLGAMLLLANVVLPGLAYATSTITVDKNSIVASVFTSGVNNKINVSCNNGTRQGFNEGKFAIDWNPTDKNLVIKDQWLEILNGGGWTGKWVWLLVDFGVEVKWREVAWAGENYGIENNDRQDAPCYWATSDTQFIVWLRPESDAVKSGSMTFQNSWDANDKITINVEFKTWYTVKFDANGWTLWDWSEDQVVAYSGSVTKPSDPTKNDSTLCIWKSLAKELYPLSNT